MHKEVILRDMNVHRSLLWTVCSSSGKGATAAKYTDRRLSGRRRAGRRAEGSRGPVVSERVGRNAVGPLPKQRREIVQTVANRRVRLGAERSSLRRWTDGSLPSGRLAAGRERRWPRRTRLVDRPIIAA